MKVSEYIPQIKICGLTEVDVALSCVGLGADAIGFVFFPKSPRFIADDQARRICEALPKDTSKIGVFVDEPFDSIMKRVRECGLTGIQLHGQEPPEFIRRFVDEGIFVIKGLFTLKSPRLTDVDIFDASAYLVECGKGKLPGGNAMAWNWSEACEFGMRHPCVLAGGLGPENVAEAISQCLPDAVDVSSGVEFLPGKKDVDKVERFIQAVRCESVAEKYASGNKRPRPIFVAAS